MTENQQKISIVNDPLWRGRILQTIFFILVAYAIYYLYQNLQHNLQRQSIATGFGFFSQEAGFEIGEKAIPYSSYDTYLRALGVGIINTLKIAIIGNILAIALGIIVGVASRSTNFLVSKISYLYIEGARNFPLILQLFFWYTLFSEIAPNVSEAYEPLPHLFISNRGVNFPFPEYHIAWIGALIAFGIGAIVSIFVYKKLNKKRIEEGVRISKTPFMLGLLLGIPALVWLVMGAPFVMSFPEFGRYNFENGATLSPEFVALLFGLVFYTGAFNAEIVRSGIDSVKKGQWEAAKSLGLSGTKTLSLVILPQALRVIIPPITSQILNLTKNSSLAVAIAYPDFISVANTTLNQTGQAVEVVLLIMGVYLFFSLLTSALMNLYNKKMGLKER